MTELISYYDIVISALDGIRTLIEVYSVPPGKVLGLSHHALDIRILIDQMGVEIFDRLAGYGVVGYQLFDASVIFGIKTHPMVVHLGVDFDELCVEIPERLTTVGYAGSFSQQSADGIELKRGALAEEAAREAGLEFKVAGSTANQISFHDMPTFYKSVDAVLVSSVTEGAGLPAREGAAAGRLVISTPVGDFPLLASKGIGIITPIEAAKYKDFVAATLKHYKESPTELVQTCRKAQDAARQLDWEFMIDHWIELIETAKLQRNEAHPQASFRQSSTETERTLALVTANFGGIDAMKAFPVQTSIDTYYYTDKSVLSRADHSLIASWSRVINPDYPRNDFTPRLRGRYFKHQIHRIPEMERYRWLAWADGSVQFRDPSFLLQEAQRLAVLAPRQRIALLPHPDRKTVREEYEFILQQIEGGNEYLRLRYATEKMTEQMNFFVSQGWNLDAPLWCGTLWLIENNDLIRRCWDSWWDQNLRYGMMDQLSLPVLLCQFGLEPQEMPLNIYNNIFFEWNTHQALM